MQVKERLIKEIQDLPPEDVMNIYEMRIPDHSGHLIHGILATDSTGFRPPIPEQAGH
jgi:hypothetical protein